MVVIPKYISLVGPGKTQSEQDVDVGCENISPKSKKQGTGESVGAGKKVWKPVKSVGCQEEKCGAP